MKAFLFSLCYNILYTVGWLVTLPSYLLKPVSYTHLTLPTTSRV